MKSIPTERRIDRKEIFRVALLQVSIAAVIALIGIMAAGVLRLLDPIVSLHIRNESGKPMDVIQFYFGNSEMEGTLSAPGISPALAPGVAKTYAFPVASEGHITVEAKFKDGSTLKGQPDYLERGDAFSYVITADKICIRRLSTLEKFGDWFGTEKYAAPGCAVNH